MRYNPLTEEEARIVEGKGTEAPGTGEYENTFRDGVYICRRCGKPLYDAASKFKSGCGWPSFDDEFPGAVKRQTDADGLRTEISCANCGAHLGHVFTGERMTEKDTRHCVNSASVVFVPVDFQEGERNYAVLGGGCFWCFESAFKKVEGVEDVVSGYSGGSKMDPTYEEVSAGDTGHAEVVRVAYDKSKISYRDILEMFFVLHDPTTENRQGNDIGEQYRSIILYKTLKQKEEAEAFIAELEKDGTFDDTIKTSVEPLIRFFPAEGHHQAYHDKNPEASYCRLVIDPKLDKFRKRFHDRMKK